MFNVASDEYKSSLIRNNSRLGVCVAVRGSLSGCKIEGGSCLLFVTVPDQSLEFIFTPT